MKIAYLSTFYPFKGGIAKFNSMLFNELTLQGHEVKAFTFTTQYPKFLYGKGDQFAEKRYDSDIEGDRILSTVNPFSWFTAARKIKKFNPDLLIMKYWMTEFSPALGSVYRMLSKKTKIITIIDNIKPHESKAYDKVFNKYFLQRQNGFIVMSEEVKKDLYSIKKNAKALLIPHPIYNYGEKIDKATAIINLNLDRNKKTILYFGLIRYYKGLDLLIEAFSELDDTFQLIIAGECREKAEFYFTKISNSKNKNILFVNKFISDDDVNKYFSAADVCILPYRSATQSGITAVSFHFELPMIATRVGGLAEIIKDGKTGLIVNEVSAEKIKNTIINYFENTDIEKFTNNIKAVKNELSWQKFTEKLVTFAEEIIN